MSKEKTEQQDTQEETKAKRSVAPERYRKRYGTAGNNGDELAAMLKEATALVSEIGRQNDIDVEARWGKRNTGMQRMNLGNMLRARLRKGTAVKIGELTIEGQKQDQKQAS